MNIVREVTVDVKFVSDLNGWSDNLTISSVLISSVLISPISQTFDVRDCFSV